MTAALVTGWVVALACAAAAAVLRHRLRRVADAEHELRGALTAFGLCVDRFGRTAAGRRLAVALESELARARAALADLSGTRVDASPPVPLERLVRSAARAWGEREGDREIEVEWSAGGPLAAQSPGRVAQALGNVVSNAVEHGAGPVRVRALRSSRAVRIEVANGAPAALSKDSPHPGVVKSSKFALGGRGRGLRIAGRAARAAGGRLTTRAAPDRVVAALELPVER